MTYEQTKAEKQSGLDRVRWAELLIQQLPADHEGRNTWLLNYGRNKEACDRRLIKRLKWDERTQACETARGWK